MHILLSSGAFGEIYELTGSEISPYPFKISKLNQVRRLEKVAGTYRDHAFETRDISMRDINFSKRKILAFSESSLSLL
jgi:hypothetical protein